MAFTVKPAAGPAAPAGDASAPAVDPLTIPVIKAVAEADVPGVLFSEAELSDPSLAAITGPEVLKDVPVSVYRGKSGVALFNPSVVTLGEMRQMDSAGKLGEVLEPAAKYLGAGSPEPETPGAGLMSSAGVAPAPPKLTVTRARASGQGNLPPTRQPVPAGGSLLNQFVRSPV